VCAEKEKIPLSGCCEAAGGTGNVEIQIKINNGQISVVFLYPPSLFLSLTHTTKCQTLSLKWILMLLIIACAFSTLNEEHFT